MKGGRQKEKGEGGKRGTEVRGTVGRRRREIWNKGRWKVEGGSKARQLQRYQQLLH